MSSETPKSPEEPFWIYQPSILFTKFETDLEHADSTNQYLNNATRLILILFPIVVFAEGGVYLASMALIVAFIIVIIWGVIYHKMTEGFTCQAPTINNPLMNVQLGDIRHRHNRPPACPAYDPQISTTIRRYLNDLDSDELAGIDQRLFHSPEELWGKQSMERQFYANPATTIPNDRQKFMNWCWNIRNVCKDGDQEECIRYEDPRLPDNDNVFF